jgi:hypothetical protein
MRRQRTIFMAVIFASSQYRRRAFRGIFFAVAVFLFGGWLPGHAQSLPASCDVDVSVQVQFVRGGYIFNRLPAIMGIMRAQVLAGTGRCWSPGCPS